MKQPTEADFDVRVTEKGVDVYFKPGPLFLCIFDRPLGDRTMGPAY